MTLTSLALRGLAHHWRSHLGVLLGAAVGSAVLVGALVVGDSVRYTLHAMGLFRLGKVEYAVVSGERLFRDELADEVAKETNALAAPALLIPSAVSRSDGEASANNVQVVGVDERFWKLGGEGTAVVPLGRNEVVLNERLARQLNANIGDSLVLKVTKPSGLSRDAPLSTEEDATVKVRVDVKAIASDHGFGRFGLQANQVPPYNAFVSLSILQKELATGPRANLLLLGGGSVSLEQAQAALKKSWTLSDAQLELHEVSVPGVGQELELRTSRVFLDDFTTQPALKAGPTAHGVLGYFVNEFRIGEKSTPYSIVVAVGAPLVPADLKVDEVVINSWLADDLGAKVGDKIDIKYYVMGPMRKLEDRVQTFKVRAVVPIEGAAADRTLMPNFPGLKDAENCREWDPGFKIDTSLVRDKDQKYWDEHRGTPKAFLSLAAGQNLWKNRFGDYTAVRYPSGEGAKERIAAKLREDLNPSLVGLNFLPVRAQAEAAGANAMNFGGLFIGFSFFLIVAALLLMGLLFRFSLERRTSEIGTLLALGFPAWRVRRLLLAEGLGIAVLGGSLGVVGGVGYARTMLYGLATAWRGAVNSTSLFFHAEPMTLVAGALASVLLVLLTIWLGVRSQARKSARELLGAGVGVGVEFIETKTRKSRASWWAIGCTVVALGIVGWAGPRRDAAAAGAFFGAGFLLLGAGVALGSVCLTRWSKVAAAHPTATGLSLRNAARRRGRSMATLALLASGVFLVVAVGANRHDPALGAENRSSGTGGFALFAQASLPLIQDLNSDAGRDTYNLSKEEMDMVSTVPFRVRAGDDASCLNLNRAQTPQLWGVDPQALAQRESFSFDSVIDRKPGNRWLRLSEIEPDGAIPAIGDTNSVMWALGQSVGGTLNFTDGRGAPFKVRIVASLATSILQGGLIISEKHFLERFPNESGYRLFLIDAPTERMAAVSKALSEELRDQGFEVQPAARRLAEFAEVENTYLSTFQILGGLGLLLGSIGMGVLVMRNVLERRGELALLRAVGFRIGLIRWLVAGEHTALFAGGLLCGLVAALVAVVPALRSPGADVPYESLGLTVSAVALSGLLWTWLAVTVALRGNLLDGLRADGS